MARADRRHLERILANLIGNAVKYSPPGSTVTIGGGSEAQGDGPPLVRCWVRDESHLGEGSTFFFTLPSGETAQPLERIT